MKVRFPLYARILIWFFLNLIFLGAVFFTAFRMQFRLGLDSLLLGHIGERVQAASQLIADELSETPEAQWKDVLGRFNKEYAVQFLLFRSDGTQAAGDNIPLPAEVMAKLTERRGPPQWRSFWTPPPPPPEGTTHHIPDRLFGPRNRFLLRTESPTRYWVGVSMPRLQQDAASGWPNRMMLLVVSPTIIRGGLFFDPKPWIVVGFGAVICSVLFWIPLVRSLTRSIGQMTRVTEQIAEGHFDARVATARRDELGRLGHAVNRMAARLAGFVTGQKRFLGDTAHELCAPIARMQMALGILEERAGPGQQAYVRDVREELQNISNLVNELLSFSKASLRQNETKLAPVNVAAIARRVVEREAPGAGQAEVRIPDNLQALAEPELLARALANLVRNALRYAGSAGSITLSAGAEEGRVIITVADQGPGVPEESLQQIFDPFFRLENSRSRETGGIGLGLAIVKTCVEACRGTVTARNRAPSGLQVDITLKSGAA